MSLYKSIIHIANKIGLRKPIQNGMYKDLLKATDVGDVVLGDSIEIDGQEFVYRGMNKFGGPGQAHYAMSGCPTPIFSPPDSENKITMLDTMSFPYWKKCNPQDCYP